MNRLKNWKPAGDRWSEKHLVALKSAAAELSIFNPNKQAYSSDKGPYLLVQDLLQDALVFGLMDMNLQDIATEIATTRGSLDYYLKIVSNRTALQPTRPKQSDVNHTTNVSNFNNDLLKMDRGNWKRVKEPPIVHNGSCQHGTPVRSASPCLKCYDFEVCAIHANDQWNYHAKDSAFCKAYANKSAMFFYSFSGHPDSGSTCHISNSKSVFLYYTPAKELVGTIAGSFLCHGRGEVMVSLGTNNESLLLKKMFFIAQKAQ